MKLSTNSGSPFFTKRRLVVDQSLSGVTGKYRLTAVLGWRGQEGGPTSEDVKQRAVFMMPFSLNIDELRFYQPAIEAIQKHKLIPAYVSSELVEETMTKLFDTKGPNDLVIATDFTKMDHSFNYGMQNLSRVIIEGILTQDTSGKE